MSAHPHLRAIGDAPDAATAVLGRVLATLHDLVPRMGQAYRDEIPEYAEMSDDLMEREVLVTSRRVVEEFISRVMAGRDTRSMDVRPAVAGAGRRRLHMGIPLEAGLHAFRIAGREMWEAVVDATRPARKPRWPPSPAHWIEYVDRASTAFAEGYLEASRDQLRRLDTRRRATSTRWSPPRPRGCGVGRQRVLTRAGPPLRPVLIDGDDVATHIDGLLDSSPDGTLAATAATGCSRCSSPTPHGPPRCRHWPNVPRVLDPLQEQDPDGVFAATLRTYLACGSVPETADGTRSSTPTPSRTGCAGPRPDRARAAHPDRRRAARHRPDRTRRPA
jgi:hypothetical protein